MDRRLLIVDRNDVFLDGLAAWLSAFAGVEVVGRAHSAAEALEQVERLRPDLVLLEFSLPDGRGLDVTRRIKAARPVTGVLLLSLHTSETLRMAAWAAGAEDCVLKTEVSDRLQPVLLRLLGRPRRLPRRALG